MPFGTGTVITNGGKKGFIERLIKGAAATMKEPKFLAMGTGATGAARTAAAADTALSTEVETRTSGTESQVTESVTGDTWQNTGSQTATSSRSVDEAASFDASAGGNMFTSATFPVISLNNGDSITWTWRVKLA